MWREEGEGSHSGLPRTLYDPHSLEKIEDDVMGSGVRSQKSLTIVFLHHLTPWSVLNSINNNNNNKNNNNNSNK